MLKKVGIVAAAATAALIALTPLAFADGDGKRHHNDDETTNVWIEENEVERDQVNFCDFDQDHENAGIGALVEQHQNQNCVNAGDDAEVILPAPALLDLP